MILKIYYQITFYYQTGYILSITEQKVTNSSFYLNQNDQQLVKTILALPILVDIEPSLHETKVRRGEGGVHGSGTSNRGN